MWHVDGPERLAIGVRIHRGVNANLVTDAIPRCTQVYEKFLSKSMIISNHHTPFANLQ
jgi:hypothetical protein